MRFSIKHLLLIIAFPAMTRVQAQQGDTAAITPTAIGTPSPENKRAIPTVKKPVLYRSLIVPGMLVVYGISSLESHHLKTVNARFKEELWQENPHQKITIDKFLHYTPAIAVYGLNALGIKGRNNFRDRSMIFLMSNIFMSSTVFGMKKLGLELRPDGSDYYSFPSGHTAEAFAAAEFLRQEYKEVSPWYGIAGYMAAGTTGFLRMYNNRHWLSDVLAGAGIGMASTKLAYWIYPAVKKKLFKDKPMNTMILPFYQSKVAGIAMVYHFH